MKNSNLQERISKLDGKNLDLTVDNLQLAEDFIEIQKNTLLIPSVPAMNAIVRGDEGNKAGRLRIERSKIPLGSPFEDHNFIITSYFGDRVFNHQTQDHRGIDLVPV